MKPSSVRPTDGAEKMLQTYGNLLFRLCLILLGSEADAEDAVQETMLKYLQKAPVFESAEHEKAWLITTAKNKCRDMLRFRARHPQIPLEEAPNLWDGQDARDGRDMQEWRVQRDLGRRVQKDAGILDGAQIPGPESADSRILEALCSLPEKFRIVLTLYYVEEIGISEIAGIIRRTPSAVKMRLQKGRKLLEEKYREEYL